MVGNGTGVGGAFEEAAAYFVDGFIPSGVLVEIELYELLDRPPR